MRVMFMLFLLAVIVGCGQAEQKPLVIKPVEAEIVKGIGVEAILDSTGDTVRYKGQIGLIPVAVLSAKSFTLVLNNDTVTIQLGDSVLWTPK